MINRVLLRIKVVQMLYAYKKNPSKSVKDAVKELNFSIEQAYSLYNYLLLLVVDVSNYTLQRFDEAKSKYLPTDEDLNPDMRFTNNRLAKLLSNNKMLISYAEKKKFSWFNHSNVLKSIYYSILESECYKQYLELENPTFDDDKELWINIFSQCVVINQELLDMMEDWCIYWVDDLHIVYSFVQKTIKFYHDRDLENMDEVTAVEEDEKSLFPMFRKEEDREFALGLFSNAIEHEEEYGNMIKENAKNWDFDRIAFMDTIVMQLAITEFLNFPTIPVNATLNEYIEIAKDYSTDKSYSFVNGVLNNVINQLKKENRLIKAHVMSSK